jgi:HEAT repeat protein
VIATKRLPKRDSNRLIIGLCASILGVLALLVLFLAEQTPLQHVVAALRGQSALPASGEVLDAIGVVAIPVILTIIATFLLNLLVRAARIAAYARALHAYSGQFIQRHAVLRDLGIAPALVRFEPDGTPSSDGVEPLLRLVQSHQRLLVLGESGAGKTLALYTLTHELTRRRALLPALFRRAPLPVLVSLAGYAQSPANATPGELRVDYLVEQVARFSSGGLARRAADWVRAGRFVLLCDGLDDVPEHMRSAVCAELATLGSPVIPLGRIVLTCGMQAYISTPSSFAPLRRFQRLAMAEIDVDEAASALRKVGGPTTKTPTLDLSGLRVERAVANASQLAALITLVKNQCEMPCGRGQLLHEYATLLCQLAVAEDAWSQRATDGSEEATAFAEAKAKETAKLGIFLSALAGSLRQADTQAISLEGATRIGEAVATWLKAHEPITANDHRTAMLSAYTDDEADLHCRAAIRAGILVVRIDGRAVSFAHTLLEDAYAAWWLYEDDDGLGRLQADLLRPRWALPVILWSAIDRDPADVAKRLLRLVDSPDSTAARAGLANRAGVYPAVLALAVAAAVESFSTTIAQPPATELAATRALDLAQQHLRDLLDQVYIYTDQGDQQARLARALQQVEERSGPELSASIAYLTKQSTLNRLLRAQLVGILGMLASPAALDALTEMLADMDAVIRQATDAAFRQAGVLGLGPLQAAMANGSRTTRERAGEVLAGLGEIAVENATVGLSSQSAPERVASARALGLLRTHQAVEPLVARLDDGESEVRVAAARALGEIGGSAALQALREHAATTDPTLRAVVATALGSFRDPATVPTLINLLKDLDPEVRTAAAEALGRIGDTRAIEPLRELRGDPDPRTQHAVVGALRRTGKPAVRS